MSYPSLYHQRRISGTTEKILRLEGISLQDCETYGEQIACMVQYHRQYADRAAVAPRGSFYSALDGLGFVPWESEENDQILSSEILKMEMLNKEEEVYKETVDQIYMDERESFFTERQNLCVNCFNYPDFEILCLLGGAEGGILVPKMSAEAGRMRADSLYTAAISASSPNKENAWNFIKLLLGESYQNQLLGGLPVRKDSLELWFEKQYEEFGKDAVLVGGVSCPAFPENRWTRQRRQYCMPDCIFPSDMKSAKITARPCGHIMKGKRRWMRAWRNSGIIWRSIIRNR